MSDTPKHEMWITIEDGYARFDAVCPHRSLGSDRPCAVWDCECDEDGESDNGNECWSRNLPKHPTKDECFVTQLVENVGEDVVHGSITFVEPITNWDGDFVWIGKNP